MNHQLKTLLLRQFEISWALTCYHLESLTTEECLWRPAPVGLHVQQNPAGQWVADWPEHEGYDLGPSSIAWLTWHLGFWWSMVIDHSFGEAALTREQVVWPGNAAGLWPWIEQLQQSWQQSLETLTDADLATPDRTRWPFQGQPFADVVAWANLELMKSAAEIGYVRFLYAAS